MNQHGLIIKLIDNLGELRQPELYDAGVCFGLSMAILASLFAGNLKTCLDTLDSLAHYFPSPLATDIKAKFKAYDALLLKRNKSTEEEQIANAYINIVALLSHVVIMQTPRNYKHLFETIHHTSLNHQHDSIAATNEFILFQSGDIKEEKSISILYGLSIVFTQAKLKHFFWQLASTIEENEITFGCLFSTVGHTVGCAYNPIDNTWIMLEINPYKITSTHKTFEEMALRAWEAIKHRNYIGRTVYVHPMTNVADGKRVQTIIDEIRQTELAELKQYSVRDSCDLYTHAFCYKDEITYQTLFEFYKNRNKPLNFTEGLIALSNMKQGIFHYAVQENLNEVCFALITHGSQEILDEVDINGDTPLICAVKSKNIYIATAIVKSKKTNILIKNKDNHSAMHYAAEAGFTDLLKMMINAAPINVLISKDFSDFPGNLTLFQFAAKEGLVDILTMLINQGVDINAPISDGSTPLHIAVRCGQFEAVKLLLGNRNTNISAIDTYGNTALFDSIARDRTRITHFFFNRLNEQGILLSYTVLTTKQWTILHAAAALGNTELVEDMIKNGADINSPAADGSTALHIAVQNGKMGTVRYLLTLNTINLYAKDYQNKMASEYKPIFDTDIIIKMLEEKLAQISTCTSTGFMVSRQSSAPVEATPVGEKRTFHRSSC